MEKVGTFEDTGLSNWLIEQLRQMTMNKPTPVQFHCIPKVIIITDD